MGALFLEWGVNLCVLLNPIPIAGVILSDTIGLVKSRRLSTQGRGQFKITRSILKYKRKNKF